MGIPPFEGRDEGGWYQVDIDIYLQAEEYSCIVHSYSPHFEPITGYEE